MDSSIGSTLSRGPCAWENIVSFYACQQYIGSEIWDFLYSGMDPEERNALIKPDVVAPGEPYTIYSTYASSGPQFYYNGFSETSIAAPHVAGTAALMLEANPNIEPEDMARMLQLSAIDLGAQGTDNVYSGVRAVAHM